MLVLDQAFDSVWIQIQYGVDADIYVPTAGLANVYDIMVEFVAWANNPARPASWGVAGLVFAWSWARDPATGGALLTLSANLAFSINTVTGGLNIPMMVGHTSSTGTYPAQGTWVPSVPIAISAAALLLGEGDAGGSSLIRPGSPGIACGQPKVEAIGTALDAARLAGILALAQTPRRGWMYQVHTGTWFRFAIGAISRSAEGAQNYRFTFEVSGTAI